MNNNNNNIVLCSSTQLIVSTAFRRERQSTSIVAYHTNSIYSACCFIFSLLVALVERLEKDVVNHVIQDLLEMPGLNPDRDTFTMVIAELIVLARRHNLPDLYHKLVTVQQDGYAAYVPWATLRNVSQMAVDAQTPLSVYNGDISVFVPGRVVILRKNQVRVQDGQLLQIANNAPNFAHAVYMSDRTYSQTMYNPTLGGLQDIVGGRFAMHALRNQTRLSDLVVMPDEAVQLFEEQQIEKSVRIIKPNQQLIVKRDYPGNNLLDVYFFVGNKYTKVTQEGLTKHLVLPVLTKPLFINDQTRLKTVESADRKKLIQETIEKNQRKIDLITQVNPNVQCTLEEYLSEVNAKDNIPQGYGMVSSNKKLGKYFQVSEKIVYNHNFGSFRYGEHYSALFAERFGELFTYPQEQEKLRLMPYGHPGLRTIVDYFTALAVSKSGQIISDAGSKYHKISKIDPNRLIEAYRPSIASYDVIYKKKYAAINYPNVILKEDVWSKELILNPESDLIAIDVIYYPGVVDCITNHLTYNQTKKAHVVLQCYNYENLGRQYYYDQEGYYYYDQVTDTITNYPAENATPYNHRAFKMFKAGMYNNITYRGVQFTTLENINTGSGSSIQLIECTYVGTKFDKSMLGSVQLESKQYQKYYEQALHYYSMQQTKITSGHLDKSYAYLVAQNKIMTPDAAQVRDLRTCLRSAYKQHMLQTMENRNYIDKLREENAANKQIGRLVSALLFLISMWGLLYYILPLEYYIISIFFVLMCIFKARNLLYKALVLQDFIFDDDLLILGNGGIGIKFLNKVSDWKSIQTLWTRVNRNLFRGKVTEEFTNMTNEEATACCQNTTAFTNPGIKWSSNATAYIMQSSIVNATWAFLSRQVGHSHSIQRSVFKLYQLFLKKDFFTRYNYVFDRNRDTVAFKDILAKHSEGKKKLYQKGFSEAVSSSFVDASMDVLQKTNELNFTPDLKPRNLFNPTPQLKALGSYIGQVLINWGRREVEGFMVGYNTGDLSRTLTAGYNQLKKPVIITWDGSNHDAHQYESLIEAVDQNLLSRMFDQAYEMCIDLPMDLSLMNSLRDALTKTEIKIKFNNPAYKAVRGARRFQRLFQGILKGTVFSGHPTRTTWGNTMRVLSYAHFIAWLAFIPQGAIKVYAAGDDVLIFLEEEYETRFYESYKRVYIHEDLLKAHGDKPLSHGLGQVGKTFNISKKSIDFLSKFGFVSLNGVVVLNRQIKRTILGGNATCKIGPSPAEQGAFNYVITAGLESWGAKWPVIRDYITYRKNTIYHQFPNQRCEDRFKQSSDLYYLKSHKNDYDYELSGVYQEIQVELGFNACSMASFHPELIPTLFD